MSLAALWLRYDCRGVRGTREDAAVTGATPLLGRVACHRGGSAWTRHAILRGRSLRASDPLQEEVQGRMGRARPEPTRRAASPPRPPLPACARCPSGRASRCRRGSASGRGRPSTSTPSAPAVGADPWDRLRAVIVGIFGAYGPSPRGWHRRPPHCFNRRRLLRLLHAADGGVQRPAGGVDADLPQVVLLLALGDPLAWIPAFPAGMAPTACSSRMTVSFSTLAVVSAVLLQRGKWKQVTA